MLGSYLHSMMATFSKVMPPVAAGDHALDSFSESVAYEFGWCDALDQAFIPFGEQTVVPDLDSHLVFKHLMLGTV